MANLCEVISGREQANTKQLMVLRWSGNDLEPSKMPHIWNSLLWAFETTYYATNHSLSFGQDTPDFYSEQFAQYAHDLQVLKIKNNASIRRIMIVDSARELANVLPTMQKQRDCKMDVHYIFWKRLRDKNAPLSWARAGLESEDFGIFDGEWVLVWKNHVTTRYVTGGRLICDTDKVRRYQDYYEQLFRATYAMPILSLRVLSDGDKARITQWGGRNGGGIEVCRDFPVRAAGGLFDAHPRGRGRGGGRVLHRRHSGAGRQRACLRDHGANAS